MIRDEKIGKFFFLSVVTLKWIQYSLISYTMRKRIFIDFFKVTWKMCNKALCDLTCHDLWWKVVQIYEYWEIFVLAVFSTECLRFLFEKLRVCDRCFAFLCPKSLFSIYILYCYEWILTLVLWRRETFNIKVKLFLMLKIKH